METMFWVWLGIVAVTLILEIVTLDLVSIWFSIGGVIPLILSAIGEIPIEIQIVVFVVISAVLIIFVRKIAQKFLFKGNENITTNVDALIGKKCRLLEDIDLEKNGSLKVNDIVWTAKSKDDKVIKKGQLVEIVGVEGNKMIVQEIKEQDNQPEKAESSNTSENDKQFSEEKREEVK